MSGLALSLVVAAALGHAGWNLLAKRSRQRLAFLWWTGVVGTVLFLPAVLWTTPSWRWPLSAWGGLALAALLRAAYLATLGVAYDRGDLSLVYPLVRGIAPLLVPPLAVVVLGERPGGTGALGIVLIGFGIYVLHLPGFVRGAWLAPLRALRARHAGPAALTGCFTAVYSVLDAWNVRRGLPPVLYAWATIPVALLLLTPLASRVPGALRDARREEGLPIILVAALMTGGYLLVLLAMRIAPVSYVAPTRPACPLGPLAREVQACEMVKRVVAYTVKVMLQRDLASLQEKQQHLLILADMVIDLYAMESVTARVQEQLHLQPGHDTGTELDMAYVFVASANQRVTALAARLLANESEGAELERHLEAVRAFTPLIPVRTIDAKTRIAKRLVADRGWQLT